LSFSRFDPFEKSAVSGYEAQLATDIVDGTRRRDSNMKRRQFLCVVGGVAGTWPLAVRAQETTRVPKVGFLYPGITAVASTRIAALREGLHAIDYADADRVEILTRAADGDPTKLSPLAADLIERKVDVIVPVSPLAVRAAQSATPTIPIVAADLESDPVDSGFVASLAHPGGNITGVFSDFPEFGMKWLQLLKEAIPALSNAVVLWDPSTGPLQLNAVETAGHLLNVKLEVIKIRSIAEMKLGFQTSGARRPDATVILSSPIFGTDPKLIAELALAQHVPVATLFPDIARAGGFMAYGPSLVGTFHQVGTMVGKVLQGFHPADLPVERPTKFEMIINLKTAKALGLAVPETLLVAADEVIE
jgi:putative tryptophan/tyrosine transport system substrate-binding protein